VTPVSGHISFALNNSRHPIGLRCISPPYCSVSLSITASAPQLCRVGFQRSCRVSTTITNYLLEVLDKVYCAAD
jgi:hypothetical protein